MSSLIIEERREPDRLVVVLRGKADLASEAVLDRELTRLSAARPKLLVIDLSELELITSLAIGQLVAMTHGIKRHGGEVVLAAAQPLVYSVLERARLQNFFRTAATVDEVQPGSASAGS